MKIFYFLLLLSIGFNNCYCQTLSTRELAQLINKDEPAWPDVQKWIAEAKNKVDVLPRDSPRATQALYEAQVTTRSPMGAIVYETGGIFIDHGWIRILGSGCSRFDRSLMQWNKGKSFKQKGEAPSFLLIADDVLGGFYAVNAGGIDKNNMGKVYYFAPDNLQWEPMNFSYTDFLNFCFNGDLKKYYSDVRWKDWEKDVEPLNGNTGFSVFPFLWTKEGKDMTKNSRSPVPLQELWALYFDKGKK